MQRTTGTAGETGVGYESEDPRSPEEERSELRRTHDLPTGSESLSATFLGS